MIDYIQSLTFKNWIWSLHQDADSIDKLDISEDVNNRISCKLPLSHVKTNIAKLSNKHPQSQFVQREASNTNTLSLYLDV